MNNERNRITSDENESKEIRSLSDKVVDASIVITMAGGSAIFTGIVLEEFLKIPITQVTTHVAVAVSSAIVGTGIGLYLINARDMDRRAP